MKILISWGSTF